MAMVGVLMQFLVEAVVLASFGGLCGIALGLGAAGLGARALDVPFVLQPERCAGGLFILRGGWCHVRRFPGPARPPT
jgi:ABC-type antimicrobial peptide transport system permease subunit